jgi:diguanylate cyclase (GGDEF)-like protein/PAS domain S-box-containing protein
MEGNIMSKPLGEEMDFFRQYNEVLFNQLEKKILDKETDLQHFRRSVDKYRWQFENISDVIFIISTDFNILSISPSVEKLLGYKAEDFIGRPASDLRHIFVSESFERAIANISKMLKGKKLPISTYTFVAKDGTLKHIEIHGSPLMRDGQVAGTISVARDISERKLIEEKLRFEEQRFRALIEHSSDIIVVINLEGTIIYMNPAVEKVLGFKPEERIGAKGFELVHPDDMKFLADSFNTLAKDTNASVIRGEMRLRHKDGGWRMLEAVGSNMVHSNVVEAIIVNYRDITDRKLVEEKLKEREEKYRELVKYAPAGIYEVDYETNLFISVNEVICEYSGYSKDELLTMNIFNLLSEESQKLMLARLEKLMANENIPQTAEYCIRTKGGEELWVLLSARYIYESGKLKGATGVVYNITERKRAEKSLKETELKFRTIFDSASDGILLLNVDDRKFSSANEKICNMLGYTKEELLKLSIHDIHPQESVPFVIDQSEKLLKKEILVAKNIPVTRKDKTVFFVDISASPIILNEKEFLVGMFRDITERKMAEEALRESEKKYRELSIIDDLTQLYNSRHFHAQLETEIERSNRYGQPLTLLLLDIDKFKNFNDKYGHVEGDNVLSKLGQVIKRCLRDPDSAYRYGGEEFTIMLPMTTGEEGIVTAKRIQTELRKENFSPESDKKINMTVSIGMAQCKPMEDMKTFVHRVDKLMYQAKKDGRDRICHDRIGHKQKSIIGST